MKKAQRNLDNVNTMLPHLAVADSEDRERWAILFHWGSDGGWRFWTTFEDSGSGITNPPDSV
ncbi:MAG: hypothetical protein ACRENP_10720 [Longimicrobiales bacterium]